MTHSWNHNSFIIHLGICITLFGIALRASAEIEMGSNFTHLIRTEHVNSHELVTTGIYAWLRHPSYTGWFYYCVGRELILCNPFCFVLSALVNWGLLYFRIPYISICTVICSFEEKYLMSFFPEYEEYRKHTYIMIPFLPNVKSYYFCLKNDWLILANKINGTIVCLG